MVSIEKTKDYLKSIETEKENKNYTISFYKKNNYLELLRDIAFKELSSKISVGYGDVNSKIFFVFKNELLFNKNKKYFQDLIKNAKIELYDIFVSFIDKTELNYSKKWNYLMNEINAISPNLIYIFDDNSESINLLLDEFKKHNVDICNKIIKQYSFSDVISNNFNVSADFIFDIINSK